MNKREKRQRIDQEISNRIRELEAERDALRDKIQTLETGARILTADNERLELLCGKLRDALAKKQAN